MHILLFTISAIVSFNSSANTVMECSFTGIDIQGAKLSQRADGQFVLSQLSNSGHILDDRVISASEWSKKTIRLYTEYDAVSTVKYTCDGWWVDYQSPGWVFQGYADCSPTALPGCN